MFDATTWATGITAVATFFIALFTWTLWRATKGAAEHVLRIERAYVKMSHHPLALDSMEEPGDFLSTWELRTLEIRRHMSQTLFLLQLSGMSFLKARIIPGHSFQGRNRSLSRTTRLS